MNELKLSGSEILALAEKLFHETHPFSGPLDPHDLMAHWIREATDAVDYYNTVKEFLHERGLD